MAPKSVQIPETSPATPASKLLHLVAVAVFTNAFHLLYQPSPFNNVIFQSFGSHWQFLTVIGLGLSQATMICALAKDWLPDVKAFDVLKNGLALIACPLEGMVSILYWSISTYDPKLMTPADVRLPLILDLSIHLAPALLLWTDYLFFSPPFAKWPSPTVIAVGFGSSYLSWMELCQSKNDPYPFLDLLALPYRAAFYAVAIAGMIVNFHIANHIHFAVDRMMGRNIRRAKLQEAAKSK